METSSKQETALVNQLKTNDEKMKDKTKIISEQAFKLYELEEEYELEKGRSQCYKLQMVELEQTIKRQREDHEEELAKERSFTHEEIKIKEKEVEIATRALAMTRWRLQQAEDTINEFMENPTADPTTETRLKMLRF